MHPSTTEALAVICFSAALVNSLFVSSVAKLGARFAPRSVPGVILHAFSEIELVFGAWAIIYWLSLLLNLGPYSSITWLGERNFSEALFIIAIMIIASTRPILNLARQGINSFAKMLPASARVNQYAAVLFLGPLFGSLITEPATMTVCALLLSKEILPKNASQKMLYSTLAVLFVNISIGGVLTHFAAPPVLMVAQHWDWNTPFMFENFGWKSILAVSFNTLLVSWVNKNELRMSPEKTLTGHRQTHFIITLFNLIFLIFIILSAHHPLLLGLIFAIFLIFSNFTRSQQGEIAPSGPVQVGIFLAGIIILTAEQGFWLKPLFSELKNFELYVSAIGLTAITDNAAITSLAAQVPNLDEGAKYSVLAGAVAGGGLTLIANAPNPAGYAILKHRFPGGLKPQILLKWALIPTLIASGILWIHA